MLGPDVVVAELERFSQTQLEDFLRSGSEGNMTRGSTFSLADDFLHCVSYLGQVDPLTHQHLGANPFRLVQQPQQKMLSTDVRVVEEASLFLRQYHDSTGSIGEALEHGPTVPLLMESIRREIESTGPIPFERFMELALYGPGGFFAGDRLRSVAEGDFLTSPEVSPLFGETLARFVSSLGGEPILIEAGAGSGSLLHPLLEALDPVEAWAIDASPAARHGLGRVLPLERVLTDIGELPRIEYGVLIANELIDNLPMALAQLTPSGWRERYVGLEGDGFAFVDAPPRQEVASWLDRFAGPVPENGWVEVQLGAATWLASVSERISRGTLVLIDYGELAENLAHRRADGTLRTYRKHHLGPHPLDEPGETDLTADVNFTALLAIASDLGWEASLHRQDDFLRSLGLDDRLAELRRQELALVGTEELERLRLRSLRTGGETLLHERGLGDFRVMIARR